MGALIPRIVIFAGFLPRGAVDGGRTALNKTLVGLLHRTLLPADGQAPAHATTATGHPYDAAYDYPHKYGVVDTAIAPVVGVVIAGDSDVDGGEVLHVHGVEGVDEFEALV